MSLINNDQNRFGAQLLRLVKKDTFTNKIQNIIDPEVTIPSYGKVYVKSCKAGFKKNLGNTFIITDENNTFDIGPKITGSQISLTLTNGSYSLYQLLNQMELLSLQNLIIASPFGINNQYVDYQFSRQQRKISFKSTKTLPVKAHFNSSWNLTNASSASNGEVTASANNALCQSIFTSPRAWHRCVFDISVLGEFAVYVQGLETLGIVVNSSNQILFNVDGDTTLLLDGAGNPITVAVGYSVILSYRNSQLRVRLTDATSTTVNISNNTINIPESMWVDELGEKPSKWFQYITMASGVKLENFKFTWLDETNSNGLLNNINTSFYIRFNTELAELLGFNELENEADGDPAIINNDKLAIGYSRYTGISLNLLNPQGILTVDGYTGRRMSIIDTVEDFDLLTDSINYINPAPVPLSMNNGSEPKAVNDWQLEFLGATQEGEYERLEIKEGTNVMLVIQ